MKQRPLVALLCAASLQAAAPASAASAVTVLATGAGGISGCYGVQLVAASAPAGAAAPAARAASTEVLPALRLTREAAGRTGSGQNTFRVVAVRRRDRLAYADTYWEVTPDGIRITMTNTGRTGMRYQLQPKPGGFAGSLEEFADFGLSAHNARPVLLRRRACPAPGKSSAQ